VVIVLRRRLPESGPGFCLTRLTPDKREKVRHRRTAAAAPQGRHRHGPHGRSVARVEGDTQYVRFEFLERAALCDVERDAPRRHLQGSGHDEGAKLRRQTLMRQLAVGLGHAEEMLVVATLLDVFEHRARQQLEVGDWPVRQVTA
jgi:hypothetical protein